MISIQGKSDILVAELHKDLCNSRTVDRSWYIEVFTSAEMHSPFATFINVKGLNQYLKNDDEILSSKSLLYPNWAIKFHTDAGISLIPSKDYIDCIGRTMNISSANAQEIIDAFPMMLGENAVVFDLETTGLNERSTSGKLWHEIVQFAAKSLDGSVDINMYIKPKRPNALLKKDKNGESAYDVNGIHPDDLINAPTFREAYPQIRQALEGKYWVCWNADFDVKFLDGVCDKRGLDRICRLGTICAMKLLSPLAGKKGTRRGKISQIQVQDGPVDHEKDAGLKAQKLSILAGRMGIDTRGKAHEAGNDVDMTIAIMNWAHYRVASLKD